MRLLAVIFLAVALVHADDVIELTDDNFDDSIKDYDVALVEFFAPWCGHCKRLAPEYEKAATSLKENDPPVPLIKVDCTANQKVCSKFGVSGYPTLKIFKGGEQSSDYDGPRDAAGIVGYMRKKAGPVSKDLTSVDAAKKFIDSTGAKEPVIVGFFSSADSELQKKFQKAADKLEKYQFAHSTNKDVNKKYKHKDEIVIFRPLLMKNKFEDREAVYESGDVTEFIRKNINGLCGYRTADNRDTFSNPLVIVYYDVDYSKNPKGTNYWRNRVMKVGKEFDSVSFAISNGMDLANELSEHGITDSNFDKPKVLAKGAAGEKYVMDTEFSMDNLKEFVTKFLAGSLEQFLKSEPLPDNEGQAVKTVVAKNFNDIVNDPTKDVLIEFYAPWCGHCKNLEPKYKELAEKLQGEPNIVIAKMDATANDVPQPYNVRGFPTIFFAPAGSKTAPKTYNGGREVNDFLQYIAKESTEELKGFNRKGAEKKEEL